MPTPSPEDFIYQETISAFTEDLVQFFQKKHVSPPVVLSSLCRIIGGMLAEHVAIATLDSDFSPAERESVIDQLICAQINLPLEHAEEILSTHLSIPTSFSSYKRTPTNGAA